MEKKICSCDYPGCNVTAPVMEMIDDKHYCVDHLKWKKMTDSEKIESLAADLRRYLEYIKGVDEKVKVLLANPMGSGVPRKGGPGNVQ